jgi:hypothetical protein
VSAGKPTVGAAVFAAYPNRPALWAAVGVLALSIAVMPGWPLQWREALSANIASVPALLPGGFLLLLGLVHWRSPEARLLAALACVPQTIGYYEMLPLFLIPRRRGEA